MRASLLVQSTGTAPGAMTQVILEDYVNVVKEVEITTNRMDAPGQLSFTCLESGRTGIREGSSVEFVCDGVRMFKGYVRTIEQEKNGEIHYKAYDQLRYLKANASYVFENMTLSQIIQQIALDFGLMVGTLDDSGYIFPCLVKEDESCLDIIFEALYQTIIQTGKLFVFYDNAGALTLTEARNMFVPTVIGDGSLALDYTYKRDIDSDTYNRIKLVKKNEETGRTDVYIHEDTENIKKWGVLQYYSVVDQNLNEAQIDEMCRMYLQYYNRVLRTLSLEALGVPQIRAGSIVPVRINAVNDLSSMRLLLAEKVIHRFDGGDHTMTVEVKSFEELGGGSIV